MEKIMKTKSKSYYTLSQKFTALVMAIFMLLQICLPAVAAAGVMIDDAQLVTQIGSPVFTVSSDNNYAYQSALMLNKDASSDYSIASFYNDYNAATGASLVAPQKIIGDSFVQNRLIRAQVRTLLGRFLIDKNVSPLSLSTAEKKQYEDLFKAGITFAKNKSKTPGARLTASDVDGFGQNFIWPEVRVVNGKQLLAPVIYLTQSTADTRDFSGHLIEFNGNVLLGSIVIEGVTITAGRGALIESLTNIVNNNGVIAGSGDLTLKAGSTLSNLSGNISATQNLAIFAGQVNNKTLVFPFKDKNGVGTRVGIVSKINAGGNLEITADNDITYTGATSTSGGTITLTSHGDITLEPVANQTESQTQEGHWRVNQSTLDLLQSKLTAEDTISLIADGQIKITASELLTKGGINLLAGQGIYVADEQGNFQSTRSDKIGKTTGNGSDFRSWAVRSALSAGKDILISSDAGDITLRATKIDAAAGTSVHAKNGAVNLLIAKEQSQHLLNTVRKGMWTIKTKTVNETTENPVPNSIVGGFSVEALKGVNVEYTGKEGVTLAQQIAEYEKMPDMKWMATIYNNGQVSGNVNWSHVELAYISIHESNTSLSPAAMAIIAICVAVAMGPAGFNALSAISGSVGGGFAGAALSAGALTLTTSAAQNIAAGKSLDETIKAVTSDEGLKSLAVSMATAGAMNYLQVDQLSLFKGVNQDTVSAASLTNQAYQAVVSSIVKTGISVTINGGNSADYLNSFKTNLATYAVDKIGQKMANSVGSAYKSGDISNLTRYIAHAGAGCLIGVASASASGSGDNDSLACYSGAGGAVVGEYVADEYKRSHVDQFIADQRLKVEGMSPEQIQDYYNSPAVQAQLNRQFDEMKAAGVDLAKLSGAFAAFVSKGDVNIAAQTAENAAANNCLFLIPLGLLALKAIDIALTANDIWEVYKTFEEKGDVEGTKALAEFLGPNIAAKVLERGLPGFRTAEELLQWLVKNDIVSPSMVDGIKNIISKNRSAEHTITKSADEIAGMPVIRVDAGSKGGWDKMINGKLEKNAVYELDNGHVYVTDEYGRVANVGGDLNGIKLDRSTYQQLCTGQSGCVGDEGGHLIATVLGGAGDKINLVPMSRGLNRGDYKKMENELADALKADKSVTVKLEVGYPPTDTVRPNFIKVKATIDGVVKNFEFKQ